MREKKAKSSNHSTELAKLYHHTDDVTINKIKAF
jgi:hypothetical protein